jgi:hypothetical protein
MTMIDGRLLAVKHGTELRLPETRWTRVARLRWEWAGCFSYLILNIGWPFEPGGTNVGYFSWVFLPPKL